MTVWVLYISSLNLNLNKDNDIRLYLFNKYIEHEARDL